MRIYGEDLAYIHDKGFSALSEAAGKWLTTYFRQARLQHGRILDLGCGTGRMAAILSDAGYPVWGVDISREMIQLARVNAPSAQFSVGSFHTARWPADAAAVTVVGEGLNYALPSGHRPRLANLFRRAYRTLASRGVLVFDVITGPIRGLVPSRGFARGADWAVGFETTLGRKEHTLSRRITAFRRRDGAYRRSDEEHTIHVFGAADVAAVLRRAGFRVRRLRGYGELKVLPGRSVYVARKP